MQNRDRETQIIKHAAFLYNHYHNSVSFLFDVSEKMPVSPLWSSFPRTPVTPGKWPDPGRGPWGCRGGRGWASLSPRHRAGQACTRTVRCWGSGGDHSLYLWPAYEKVSDWEVKYKSKIIPVYGIKRDILLRKSCYVKPGSLFLYFALNTSRTLNLSDNTVMISTNRQLKSIFNLIIIANEFFSVSGWVFFLLMFFYLVKKPFHLFHFFWMYSTLRGLWQTDQNHRVSLSFPSRLLYLKSITFQRNELLWWILVHNYNLTKFVNTIELGKVKTHDVIYKKKGKNWLVIYIFRFVLLHYINFIY